MFSLSQEFHRARRQRNQAPLILFSLVNAFGVRVYSDRHPAEGGLFAGRDSRSLLDRGARVLSFGRLRETLTPFSGDLLASLKQEEPASVSVQLSNAGATSARPFTGPEATENLLGALGEILVGLPRDQMMRFHGLVEAYRLEADTLTLSLKAL